MIVLVMVIRKINIVKFNEMSLRDTETVHHVSIYAYIRKRMKYFLIQILVLKSLRLGPLPHVFSIVDEYYSRCVL